MSAVADVGEGFGKLGASSAMATEGLLQSPLEPLRLNAKGQLLSAVSLTATCDRDHGSRFNCAAKWRQGYSMPVLVIAVVFFAIFLFMGVMGITAMIAEHRGKLFSGKWSDQPKPAPVVGKPAA